MARLAGVVAAAVAIAGVPSLLDGQGTRFSPCPRAEGQACAALDGLAASMRLSYPPDARPVGVPSRLALVLGDPPEADPAVTRLAALRVSPLGAVPLALERLDRTAVVVGAGTDAGDALAAATVEGVDGVILVDPPDPLPAPAAPLPVSVLILVTGAPPAAPERLSVRPLVVLRRPGALDSCTRRVLAGFSREPLSPRPEVTDCRR